MITVIKQGNAYNRRVISLEGLSTDTKPVEYFIETDSNGVEVARVYIENGSTFTEIDTGKLFMYDAENNTWYEIETSGGGGGGGTSGGIVLVGETTTQLVDNATTNPITVDGQSYTAQPNDAVIYGNKEFLFDGTKWHEFGDLSGLSSKDIGAMTGYVKAQTAGAIGTNDTLNQAIGKVEKRVDDNKNNISSIKEKTDNIMIDSNRDIYIQATAPTGTIPVGSTWISGGSLKGYVQESNVSTATIEQGTFHTNGSESPNNNRVRTTFDTDMYSMGAYTVSITGANDVLVFVYDSDKTCIQSESSGLWKSLPYSFNLAGDRYVRFAFRKTYDAAISPSDVSNYALAFQGWK